MKPRPTRIPQSLQAVFIASNRGNDVTQPPPGKVASKVFKHFRLLRRDSNDSLDPANEWSANELAVEDKTSKPLVHDTSVARQVRRARSFDQAQAPDLHGHNRSAARDAPSVRLVGRTRSFEKDQAQAPSLSPQVYFDALIRSRGYSTRKYSCLQTAYSNEPTELQQTSYSIHLINLVREENVYNFEQIICAGLSPNPCNQYGESLVHMVCRRGASAFLKVLLENGCDVQVSDDMGRTPAHDACWAAKPCFNVVRMILERDPFMFQLTDCRGATPLAYVPRKDWAAWLQFLEYVKDDFWPQRDVKRDGEQQPPTLTLQPPNSRPVADPSNALSPAVAAMVSSGVLDPREAALHKDQSSADSDTVCSSDAEAGDDDEEDDDDEDSSSSSYLSDDDIDEADKEEE
jgi:hypothetical protein